MLTFMIFSISNNYSILYIDMDFIVPQKDEAPDDISEIFADVLSKLDYKKVFIVFILYILLASDVFINSFLSKINNATDATNLHPTSKGVIIQSMLFILLLIIIDVLKHNQIL